MTLIQGDCVETMRSMPEASVDAVVTDPPYGIRFMGKAWDGADIEAKTAHNAATKPERTDGRSVPRDSEAMYAGKYDLSSSANQKYQQWCMEWARECLRVLKPGGHLLASGGTRTYHRLACAIEDAGFEIRDSITWLYASGFPKSKSMKDIDRPELGTALKPAHEPIVVARKPLSESSVARNVLEHGTGALAIDASRVDGKRWPANVVLSHSPECQRVGVKRVKTGEKPRGSTPHQGNTWAETKGYNAAGRTFYKDSHHADPDGFEEVEAWECVDGCPVAELDRQSGNLKSGGNANNSFTRTDVGYHGGCKPLQSEGYYSDQGGASRFFKTFEGEPGFCYQAKASRRERGEGNGHPTVKPLALMRYLVKLVTPPGGVVLDPFVGSGSTLVAAIQEGFEAVGIEQDASYIEIAERRVAHARAEIESQPLMLEV